MNELVRVPEISHTMQEFSKEMTKVKIYILLLLKKSVLII